MIINSKAFAISRTYELPIRRIRSVVVERKSVIPFATLTVLAMISFAIIKYDLLWFLMNLTGPVAGFLSSVALLVAAVSAVPVLVRMLFVSVTVTWDGNPTTFRVGFMPVRPGKRLATRFQQLSTLGEGEQT